MEKAIIIGGGIGGLTTGALLSKHGYKVTVLEGDGEVGGCAGKFSKDLFSFPVGATFGMRFEEEGIHNKILRYLDIDMNVFPLSEAIRITVFSAPLSVFQNRKNHLKQLVQVFPHYKENLSSFYEELWKIARKVRRLIERVPAMPPKTPQEWGYLFSSLGISDVSLLPLFTKTVADLVKKHGLEDCQSFIHLLDGQIIDSMQTTIEHCSLLMGAFALDVYHEGSFYVEGGLFILARKLQSFIKHHGGEVKLHCKAIGVDKRGALFTVEDEYKQRYKAEHVVSNLPLRQLLELLEERIVQNLSQKIKDKEQWGCLRCILP